MSHQTTTIMIAANPQTMPDKLKAMKNEGTRVSLGWVLLGVGVILVLGVLLWLRARRRRRMIDRLVLTARAMECGFDEDEQSLLHQIADRRREDTDASDLVPKLRRYDAALEEFLETQAEGLDEEGREALVEKLGKLREKLGFENLPEYRYVPSTREIPSGTSLTVRRKGRPDLPFEAAFAFEVNDLDLSIRIVPEEDAPDDVAPEYAAGEELEIFFAHGTHRRCRLTTRVLAREGGDPWTIPLAHVKVDNFNLAGDEVSTTSITARLRTSGGSHLAVKINDLSGRGVTLSSPVPESVQSGTLSFCLPGESSECEVEVERPANSAETYDPASRNRLTFRTQSADTRNRILRYLSRATIPAAVS